MIRNFIIFISFFITTPCWTQDPTVGLMINSPESNNGYTLFSANLKTFLIDNCGFIINQWNSDYPPGLSVYLLENGDLIRTSSIANEYNYISGRGGLIERYNWEGDLLWTYEHTDSLYHQHHDIEILPNGNILLLVKEVKFEHEVLEKGRNPESPTLELWLESIIEINPNDNFNIVWEWHIWDHLVQDLDPSLENYGIISEHPEKLDFNLKWEIEGKDWNHANAIAYNSNLDQIMLTSRNMNEIWVIDHSTTTEEAKSSSGGNSGKGGDLLYRWGNPANYQRGNETDQKLFGPHDGKWIPEGLEQEHKIIVFNNGFQQPNVTELYSSVMIWETPLSSSNSYMLDPILSFAPDNVDWSYENDDFYSSSQSGAHALPDGHLLICEGNDGRFFEINSKKEIVWEYINPQIGNIPIPQGTIPTNNSVFRATRYPTNHPAFLDKKIAPGLPIETNPYPNTCDLYDTNVGLFSTEINGIKILNNLIIDHINILNSEQKEILISIYSSSGKLIKQLNIKDQQIKIPFTINTSGIYFLNIQEINNPNYYTTTFIKK